MTVVIEETGQAFRDIWEMIEPNINEAMNLRLRAQLMSAVKKRVKEWGLTQKEAALKLGISQPRLNLLLKGRFNDFSLDALIGLMEPAGLHLEISVKNAA